MAPVMPGHWAGILLAATILVLVPLGVPDPRADRGLSVRGGAALCVPAVLVHAAGDAADGHRRRRRVPCRRTVRRGAIVGAGRGCRNVRGRGGRRAGWLCRIAIAAGQAAGGGDRRPAAGAGWAANRADLRHPRRAAHAARHLRAVVAAVQSAKPDLIAITGDQIDDYPRDVQVFARAFRDLRAPLGVFAIPGNHDVYAGWPEVQGRPRGMGLHGAGQRRATAAASRRSASGWPGPATRPGSDGR